jgi:hypothetical protein
MPTVPKRSQSEFRLSCAVADHLARILPPDVLHSHFPAGEARTAITGARLKRMGLQKGWADYLIFHPGGVLAIELKAGAGKASDEQCAFGNKLHALGGVYRICRSLDDVDAALSDAGVMARGRVAA